MLPLPGMAMRQDVVDGDRPTGAPPWHSFLALIVVVVVAIADSDSWPAPYRYLNLVMSYATLLAVMFYVPAAPGRGAEPCIDKYMYIVASLFHFIF